MTWLAHHWQDTIFGAGGFFFALSLVPTLHSKTAEVPLKTSVPTACILGLYVVAEWTVHLRLAAIAGIFSAGAWGLVAVFRRPRRFSLSKRAHIQAARESELVWERGYLAGCRAAWADIKAADDARAVAP